MALEEAVTEAVDMEARGQVQGDTVEGVKAKAHR